MSDDKDTKQRWHVGKEIPLGMIAAVLLQTVIFVSWLSGMRNEIRNAGTRIEEIWRERYTQNDSRKDAELITMRFLMIEQAHRNFERRLEALEHK